MSTLLTQPVYKCSRCGRLVTLTLLTTFQPDPDKTQLLDLNKMFSKAALCESCKGGLNYYASQGRGQDWQRGNP